MRGAELNLSEAARLVSGQLCGDAEQQVIRLVSPARAGAGDLTFIDARYDPRALHPEAVVLVPPQMLEATRPRSVLIVGAPHQSFLILAQELSRRRAFALTTVHPTAQVHTSALLSPGVGIGPFCVVHAHVRIASGSVVHAHGVVGDGAVIGPNCSIGSHAVIGPGVVLGAGCTVHAAALVGHASQPAHCGGVIVGDAVEIGPGSVIESGELDPTVLGDRVRIGALCAIGHDSVIEAGAHLVSMVGIAGKARIGRDAVLMGQVGVAGSACVGAGALVLAKSGVAADVKAGSVAFGIPARGRREWLRSLAALRALPQLQRRVAKLQQQLLQLTGTPR